MTDWPVKTLGEICEIYQPQTIGMKDMVPDGPYIVYGANGPIGRYDRFNHENSEVTVTCRGATCGTVNVTPPHVWITGNAMVVRPREAEMSKLLLRYWLEGLDYSSVITGAAQPQITRTTLAPMKLKIPPLDEQKRIVALLDVATARVTELTACYKQARTHANNLFEKSLDVVMFKDEASHVESTLKRLTTKIGSGATPTGGQESYKTAGVPLIRSMNVHDSQFDVKGLAYIDKQQAQKLDGVTVEEGDVLLNITGASLTRTCLVPSNLVPARVNQHVSILRVKPELINERYLQLFLVSARTKSLLWEIGGAAGSTRQALTKKDLEELVVKYPLELEAQNAIVEEADKLASRVSEFVGLIDAKLTAAKNLRQSILEAAFAGAL